MSAVLNPSTPAELWQQLCRLANEGASDTTIQTYILSWQTAVERQEREMCARIAERKCKAWSKEGDGESMLRSQALYGMADAGREIAVAIRSRE